MTQLDQDLGPIYRGRPATELAAAASFEEVAELLWQTGRAVAATGRRPTSGPARSRTPSTACAGPWSCAAPPTRSAPTCAPPRWPAPPAGAAAALTDARRARRRAKATPDASIAARLAARLAAPRAPSVPTAAVNAALVLLADHELATSTMAVRVAASVRADPYDALLAGLATLAGPLHGGASQQAYELLVMAERDGVRPGPRRRHCASRGGCPASGIRSTRAATPASPRCWRWPSRC